jgi:hypothetical protein
MTEEPETRERELVRFGQELKDLKSALPEESIR